MINFNRDELRDKIYACWLGKNIGGTIGTPFEGKREVLNCTGFTSKKGEPLPNDDLDLQLIWLKAIREQGPLNTDAKILGEYWLEYIVPFWNEYGIGKANMRRGIAPPLSGQLNNYWRHSNGAWIRTEVWASLYPGNVEKAIYYAYHDAAVDHGSGEGTYAAIFVAAIEAAAFLFTDLRALIEMGLSKIPENSKMYQYITKVLECYDGGKTWLETRNIITDMTTSDPELGWFQAPANVAYAVIGLLYGKGDFKESILIACNCGDDTDCTCATAGSVLGIMHGTKIIPKDWQEYIGDSIVTVSVNKGATKVPNTCTELTDEVMATHAITLAPTQWPFKPAVTVSDAPTDLGDADIKNYMGRDFAMSLAGRNAHYDEYTSILADIVVEYDKAPEITPNGEIKVKFSALRRFPSQKVFGVQWFTPDGFKVNGPLNINTFDWFKRAVAEYTITAPEKIEAKNNLYAIITCEGHFDTLTIPVVLLG